MTAHKLDTLLKPNSIAVVGASDKVGSNGHAMITMIAIDGYSGAVYPVNPRLSELDGRRCYPDLAALPEVPDHVVIGVASRFVENILDQAIALGVKSASIFASCYLDDDKEPDLPARIARKARAAGMSVCGANCMGFYTPGKGLRVASMYSPSGLRSGGIAWIAQSGSTFGALAHNDRRLGFSLCVSTGMELVTTVSDYMDWALDQPNTRVIGLFLESVRDPEAFVSALERAKSARIPVVVLKVGRTEKSAQMAVSHTGAIAGNDAAYEALFRKYGVSRVSDMDEMAATLALFDTTRSVADGEIGVVSDSGGERELIVDLADEVDLSFAELEDETCAEIAKHLEPGLHPENPLDAFGTQNDLVNRYAKMIAALVNDHNVAMGFFMSNPRDGYGYAEQYTEALKRVAGLTSKTLAMVTNYSMSDERALALELKSVDVPLLRGTRNSLLAARHVMSYRDFVSRSETVNAPMPEALKWREKLRKSSRLTEVEALEMLSDFGISTPKVSLISSEKEIPLALSEMRFPIVLKTAEDFAHKSDVGGVVLNLTAKSDVESAYATMASKLGPRALLMEMAPKGPELALGAVWDDSFGPIILISAGGVLIELLDDRTAALAPVDEIEAMRLLKNLRCFELLKGVRGQSPSDLDEVLKQIVRFSQMIAALGKDCVEMDVNPLICGAKEATAVDCLAIGRQDRD